MFKAGESSISKEFLWIGDWAGRRASLTPNRQAIFDNLEKKTYTYKELDIRANQLARVLLDYGISERIN
jgi:fatty-acyl-CoA synthase